MKGPNAASFVEDGGGGAVGILKWVRKNFWAELKRLQNVQFDCRKVLWFKAQ